jgi:hypothetical protein
MGGRGGDVVFLHQGRQITGGQIIDRQPYDEDDKTDDEDMNGQDFPEESAAQAETPSFRLI